MYIYCSLGLNGPFVKAFRVLSFFPSQRMVTVQVTGQLSHTHSVQPLSFELRTSKKLVPLAIASNLTTEEDGTNSTRITSALLETNMTVNCVNASCIIFPLYFSVTYVHSFGYSDGSVVWSLAGQLVRPDVYSALICM